MSPNCPAFHEPPAAESVVVEEEQGKPEHVSTVQVQAGAEGGHE